MSVSGLCQICEVREAQFTCDNCGAVVCEDHYDEDTGLCADCVRLARGSDDIATGADDAARGTDDVSEGAEDVVDDGDGRGPVSE